MYRYQNCYFEDTLLNKYSFCSQYHGTSICWQEKCDFFYFTIYYSIIYFKKFYIVCIN